MNNVWSNLGMHTCTHSHFTTKPLHMHISPHDHQENKTLEKKKLD